MAALHTTDKTLKPPKLMSKDNVMGVFTVRVLTNKNKEILSFATTWIHHKGISQIGKDKY